MRRSRPRLLLTAFFALLAVLALGIGYVLAAMLVGEWMLGRVLGPKAHHAWSLLAGVLALGILALIPVVGRIVSGAATVTGLGALGLVALNGYRGRREVIVPQTDPVPVRPAPVPA